MRICSCCQEAKTTDNFSWNTKSKKYAANCKDCGNWIYLIAKEANEIIPRPNTNGLRTHKANKPALILQEAITQMIGSKNGIR